MLCIVEDSHIFAHMLLLEPGHGIDSAPLYIHAGRSTMADVFRLPSTDARMSPAVVHGDMIYLSGQVPDMSALDESDITLQTSQTLAKV